MTAQRTVHIGLAGCGVVGCGVVRLLAERREELARRTGVELQLARVVVRDPGRDRGLDLPAGAVSADAADLLGPDVDVVIELIGGCDAARDIVLSAIRAGKPVVTANKALIALHGAEVFAEAGRAGVQVGVEASCCGGVPIIGAIQRGLVANRIDALYGIVNGTCNYILTEMLESRRTYAEALAAAQQLGYAEADPTLDIDGTDSAHKLAILASLAFDCPIDFGRVRFEGIERIELADLVNGYELGYVCKLLAIASRYDDGVALEVLPAFLETTHPLAHVRGPFNAVSVYGHAVGHTLYYGRGAGAAPTASAVMADIVELATGTTPPTRYPAWAGDGCTNYKSLDDVQARYYTRLLVQDRPGAVADVTRVFADHEISLSAITQPDPHDESGRRIVSLVVITHRASVGSIRSALAEMQRIPAVTEAPVAIRIVDEHGES